MDSGDPHIWHCIEDNPITGSCTIVGPIATHRSSDIPKEWRSGQTRGLITQQCHGQSACVAPCQASFCHRQATFNWISGQKATLASQSPGPMNGRGPGTGPVGLFMSCGESQPTTFSSLPVFPSGLRWPLVVIALKTLSLKNK